MTESNEQQEELQNMIFSWMQLEENVSRQKEELKKLNLQKKIVEDKIITMMQTIDKSELYLTSTGEKVKIAKSNVKKKKSLKDLKLILTEILKDSNTQKQIEAEMDTPLSVTEKFSLKKMNI